MDARLYLKSYGWQDGHALKNGGIKKPILVKHKKDKKGLGSDGNDADVWWERLFDGQLKTLDVNNSSKGVSFETNAMETENHLRRSMSPLYKMFVKGEGLAGTVGKTDNAHLKSSKIDSGKAIEQTEIIMKKAKKEAKAHKDKSKSTKSKDEKTDADKKKLKDSKKEKKHKKDKKEKRDEKEVKESSEEKKHKKEKSSSKAKKELDKKSKLELKSKKRSSDKSDEKEKTKKRKKDK
ncbi:hypothetical protein C7M61_001136 [Candidozyma pseudohaemuli]|uniref:G-patch domain-containing protein n=1 Tax=Candidozyma pseudohaemuli TaxID=418784 RepID=A0A2P7YZR5_9ASCO|nr:hypothetical protein C7M61_001136 [[Candida] pseudohaemulonii]PSK41453.1 hypothetical protein C7M61_001136 [[Candida] pseudohaemulonii]